jgi:hypothetical protein
VELRAATSGSESGAIGSHGRADSLSQLFGSMNRDQAVTDQHTDSLVNEDSVVAGRTSINVQLNFPALFRSEFTVEEEIRDPL